MRRLPWELRYRYAAQLASLARRLTIQATHLHCRVEFRGRVHIGPGFSLYIPNGGTLLVGADVEFRRGFHCEIFDHGRVTIGDGTVFTSMGMIQCTTTIEIGSRCMFAQSTVIVDGSHRFRDPSLPVNAQGYDFRPIHIGDDVAVMSKCTVIADVGTHSFIGANSVVTRPIPAYSLAVGVPARVIEQFGPADLKSSGDDG